MFCSTAKGFLSNFILILCPESFILLKKTVNKGLSLELNTPFDFQLITQSLSAPVLNSVASSVDW